MEKVSPDDGDTQDWLRRITGEVFLQSYINSIHELNNKLRNIFKNIHNLDYEEYHHL